MEKKGKGNGSKIFRLQYGNHSIMVSNVFCSLLEQKSLVDLVLRCGKHSVNTHKCILAANSPYFREHLEKDKTIQQVIFTGINFSVVRSMIEYMYCGETSVNEDNVNYLVAAAKLYKIKGLLALAKTEDCPPDDNIEIPEPEFLSDIPKFSETYLYMTPIGPVRLGDPIDSSTKPNRKYDCFPVEELRRELEISKKLNKSVPKKRSKRQPVQINQMKFEPIVPRPSKYNFKILPPEPFNIDFETLKPKPIKIDFKTRPPKPVQIGFETFAPKPVQIDFETLAPKPVQIGFETLAPKPVNVDFETLEPKPVNIGFEILEPKPVQIDYETIAPQLAKLADLTVINPEQESAAHQIKELFGCEVPPTLEIMFQNEDGTLSALTEEELKGIDKNYFQCRLVEDNAADIKDVEQITTTDPEEDPVLKYLNLDATIGSPSKQSKESPKPSTSKSLQEGNTDGAGVSGIRKSFVTPDVLIPHSQFYDELSDSSD